MGIFTPEQPFYTYIPGQDNSDTITSPTELYFAQRGLLYTYVNGKRYDTTHLRINIATDVAGLFILSTRH